MKALTSLYNRKVCSHVDTRSYNTDLFPQCSILTTDVSPIFWGHIIDTWELPHQGNNFFTLFIFLFLRHVVFPVQWKSPASESHEGNSLCVYHPSVLKSATIYDWKSRTRIRMRKCTCIRAYGSAPYMYTSLNFDFCRIRTRIRIRAYGFLALKDSFFS